jgi:hypothetical protein
VRGRRGERGETGDRGERGEGIEGAEGACPFQASTRFGTPAILRWHSGGLPARLPIMLHPEGHLPTVACEPGSTHAYSGTHVGKPARLPAKPKALAAAPHTPSRTRGFHPGGPIQVGRPNPCGQARLHDTNRRAVARRTHGWEFIWVDPLSSNVEAGRRGGLA